MNFYEILEIDSRASTDEIERAYRKMARKVHPDLNAGDRGRSEARMKLLNEIRDLLTDPLLRAGYDERLRLQHERDAQRDAQRARAAPRPQPPPRAETKPADANAPPRAGRDHRRGPMLLAFGGAMAAGLLFVSFRARSTPPVP
ncbi:MAG TPA: J domain-containing protein, partial [Polyangia bacterium]|nr:J domain-containing protein [Polyangia bacterium]